jgi:VanZ family protein
LKKSQYAKLKGLFISLIIVTVAEIGQGFLPHRFPDFMDVVYAQLGSMLGMRLQSVYFKIIHFFQIKYEK